MNAETVLPSLLRPVDRAESKIPPCVSADVYWRYDVAPRGVKIFILTEGGIAIQGVWKDHAGYIGWHPLFRRDKEKERSLGLCPSQP